MSGSIVAVMKPHAKNSVVTEMKAARRPICRVVIDASRERLTARAAPPCRICESTSAAAIAARNIGFKIYPITTPGFDAHRPHERAIVTRKLASDYDTHAAYYGVLKAREPIHAQMNLPDFRLAVVNMTRERRADLTLRSQPVSLTAQVRNEPSERVVTVDLSNRRSAPALAAKLKRVDEKGQRILPAFYGDNYVTLLPGESRHINIRFPPAFAGNPSVKLRVWNVEPLTVAAGR